ncbi:MAG TPA: leucyl aminopeptidase [Streptosporangiaceae bacterium]|nr:leucyl aminopeptidase [Streptosporangiaceae bacterium]
MAVAVQQAGDPDLDSFLGVPAVEVVAAAEMTGQAGELAQVVVPTAVGLRRVFFLGLGDSSPADARAAGAALGRRVSPDRQAFVPAVSGLTGEAVAAFTEGALLGSYCFSLASGSVPGAEPGDIHLLVDGSCGQEQAVAHATTTAQAVALARDLANTPSNCKTPRWLADEAVRVAASSGLAARVWEPAELAAEGFGGILGVGSGSANPPALIELSYEPPAAWTTHIVLVGKGITFDSGGLSLKPSDGMKLMKTDMAGGAVVIAAMSALSKLGVRARVTGLVPAAENMPSGSAIRPGDVITHFGGLTSEMVNTDAEGRVVLADALAYADAVLKPDVVIDIATLTGSARIALGRGIGALYANDDSLAQALLAAGQAAGEPLWQMPLPDDYTDALASPVADLGNVSQAGHDGPGSIQAALYLREFTGRRPWAHLDVAGPARSVEDKGERTKGATGFGTRVLLRWLAAV